MWRRRQSEREESLRLRDESEVLRQEVRRFGRAVIYRCCDVLEEMDGNVAALLEQAVRLVELVDGDEEDKEGQVGDNQARTGADEGTAAAQEEPLVGFDGATPSGTPDSAAATFGSTASTDPVRSGDIRKSNSDDELQFHMDDP